MKVKKQTRHLKRIRFTMQFCDVFCIAFGIGIFFCFIEAWLPDSDTVAAFLLMLTCIFGFLGFGMLHTEYKERFVTERNAFMAENIEKGVKKVMLDNLYERDE